MCISIALLARCKNPAAPTSAPGAERKDVTLLMDFRSPSENGHSRYGHPAAQIAPFQTLLVRDRRC